MLHVIDQGCSRHSSASSIIAPVTSTGSSFVQLVRDLLDSHTVSWKSVTILYDSTAKQDGEAMKELIMQLQKRISVVVFDISAKPVEEIFIMKGHIGTNFLVVGKQETAKNIYELVRISSKMS